MKDKFPGHFFKPAESHLLWENCIFVFDTNILLNLYRYSDETRSLFIKTLQSLRENVWLPYRVATEYLENRLTVIHEQQGEYEETIRNINRLKEKLENSRQHPFVSNKTMTQAKLSLELVIEELDANKEIHSNRINSDEIQNSISEIFNGKIGDEFEDAELERIIESGTTRYKQKIPPGYSDAKKQSDDESLRSRCRPYGDLIIWESILKKSKSDSVSIVFVTDDGKEDWWLRFKGKTLGPRPELIDEFKKETGQAFHMYLPERFLSLANEQKNKLPPQEVLEEIRETRKKEESDSINRTRVKTIYTHLSNSEIQDKNKFETIQILERNAGEAKAYLQELFFKKKSLNIEINNLSEAHLGLSESPEQREKFLNLLQEIESIESRVEIIIRRLEYFNEKLDIAYKQKKQGAN